MINIETMEDHSPIESTDITVIPPIFIASSFLSMHFDIIPNPEKPPSAVFFPGVVTKRPYRSDDTGIESDHDDDDEEGKTNF